MRLSEKLSKLANESLTPGKSAHSQEIQIRGCAVIANALEEKIEALTEKNEGNL